MDSDTSADGPPFKRAKLSSTDNSDFPIGFFDDLPDELGTVGDNVTIGDSSPISQNGHLGLLLQAQDDSPGDNMSQLLVSPAATSNGSLSQLLMQQTDSKPFASSSSSSVLPNAQPQLTLHTNVPMIISKSQAASAALTGNIVVNTANQTQNQLNAGMGTRLLAASLPSHTNYTQVYVPTSADVQNNQSSTRVTLKLSNGQSIPNNNITYVLSHGLVQLNQQQPQQQQQQQVNSAVNGTLTTNLQNTSSLFTLSNNGNNALPQDLLLNRSVSQELLQIQQQQQHQQQQQLVLQNSIQLSSPAADPEKRRLIQQQLVLLLHAHKCRRRLQVNGDIPCSVPHCQTMKNVLNHMTSCNAGKNCQVPHCSSSRQIIWHWKTCNKPDCPVCSPLKTAADRRTGLGQQLSPEPGIPATVLPQSYNNISVGTPVGARTIVSAKPVARVVAQQVGSPQDLGQQQLIVTQTVGGQQILVGQQAIVSSSSGAQSLSGAVQLLSSGGSTNQVNQQQQQQIVMLPSSGGAASIAARLQSVGPKYDSQGLTALPNQPVKQWHQLVNQDLRNHLVHKLVQAIFPSPDRKAFNDARMNSLVEYARKVESDMYEKANTREEYYRMLAEKIYKIQKELEEKHRRFQQEKAAHQQALLNAGGNANQTSGDSTNKTLMAQISAAKATATTVKQESGDGGHTSLLSGLLSHDVSVPSASLAEVIKNEERIPLHDALEQLVNQSDSNLGKGDADGGTSTSLLVRSSSSFELKVEPKTEEEDTASGTQLDEKPDISTSDNKSVVSVGAMFGSLTSSSSTAAPPPKPKAKKVWKPDELRQALMPTLEKLYRQDADSQPFRIPVDPVSLGIPDYFDIIKKPMDLQTIKRKLDTGQYQDPWEYTDDIWLMIDNARTYNKRNSRVYKAAQKLADVFTGDIDSVMRAMGYCCGQKYDFQPQPLCCFSRNLCTIPRDTVYYSYQDRYVYCEKCYNEVVGDELEIVEDPTQPPLTFKKDLFQWRKNNEIQSELFVHCTECGRRNHQICVMYIESLYPSGFVCDICLKSKGQKRKENRFIAKRLPNTKLGAYLENRVNSFLRKKDTGAGEVVIRILSSSDKASEVKFGMKNRFPDEMPESFPYRAKTLFAYEEIDGVDVCFFGMHVQEYGSECPQPNTRRVYIAYLDSVHFFRPKEYRTAVYHEILIGYLDYAKTLGYCTAHIWACPPSEGDDYIFHCHPPEQRVPKPKRLQDWYRKMLDKALIEGVVVDYKDIYKDALESNFQYATQLPYFEGDFWPNVIEDCIKEVDQEENEKRQLEVENAIDVDEVEVETTEISEGKKKGLKKKIGKTNKTSSKKKSNFNHPGGDLASKLFLLMEKHKEVFFIVRLHRSSYLPPIRDPDPPVQCDLMDGRDAFLSMARERHWEFSTLRRAKCSSMAMLYELHTQGSNGGFVYTCNMCKAHIETRWHCGTCEDYDLCMTCYEKHPHCHSMEKQGFDIDADGSDSQRQQDPQEARRLSVQKCIQSLVHACQCRDANCRQTNCQKMKRVVLHAKTCQRKMNGGCPSCKQLIMLCCYHAKHCNEPKCQVPFCSNIKQKLRQQQMDNRVREANLMRRRVQQMTGLPYSNSGGSSGGAFTQQQPQQQPQQQLQQQLQQQHNSTVTVGKPVMPNPPLRAVQAAQQIQMAAFRQAAQTVTVSSLAPQSSSNLISSGSVIRLPPSYNQVVSSGSVAQLGSAVNQLGSANIGQLSGTGLVQQGVGASVVNQQQGGGGQLGTIIINQLPSGATVMNQVNFGMNIASGANQVGGSVVNQVSGGVVGQLGATVNQLAATNAANQLSGASIVNQVGGTAVVNQLGVASQLGGVNTGNQLIVTSNANVVTAGGVPNAGGSTAVSQQAAIQPAVLQRLIQSLKSPQTPQQQQQTLQILRRNPQLMALFLKQSQLKKQQQQQPLQVGAVSAANVSVTTATNVPIVATQAADGILQTNVQITPSVANNLIKTQQLNWQQQQQQQVTTGQVAAAPTRLQLNLNAVQQGQSASSAPQQLLILPQQRQQQPVTMLGSAANTQLVVQQPARSMSLATPVGLRQMRPGIQARPQTNAGAGATILAARNTLLVPISLSQYHNTAQTSTQNIILRMPSGTDASNIRFQIQSQQPTAANNSAGNNLTVVNNVNVANNSLVLTNDDVMPLTPQDQLSKYVENL